MRVKIGPDEVVVLGPQLFAGNFPACRHLNSEASANWHGPFALSPLLDSRRLNANQPGKICLPAHRFACEFDQFGLSHTHHDKAAPYSWQQVLPYWLRVRQH